MDTVLANGDFSPGSNGRPELIGGAHELFQQAMIRLNVPLGSFAYDPSLGSKLYTLKADDADFREKAAVLAQEALRPLPELTVEGVRLSDTKSGTAIFQLCCGENTAEIEVSL
jgi:hypothetical protein